MKCETPALRVGLVARPGADPVADRDRADVVEPLGDHPLAGVELGQHPVLHGRIVRASAAAREPGTSRVALWTRRQHNRRPSGTHP